ncbi:hypothetical protein [Dactylosporangium sp. CS-033363]|uniref:hypothetical protein n=1 Tax=Dactylosporangium sp. CS-033363 TaxID=3239935 RepID=UPI003D93897B
MSPEDTRWQQDVLVACRRIAAALDPPPGHLLPAARAAFLLRALDTEIALLIADTSVELGVDAYEPVRAEPETAPGRWLLSFEGGGIAVELEIETRDGRLRLIGLLSGAAAGDCFLESAGDCRPVDVDELGRFLVEDVSHGPIRLRCRSVDSGRVITTAWVTV